MKALEKDRNRRYETANGFARDVQRYLADEPVQACPPSAWYRFRKFARRNRAKLGVTMLVLFSLAALGGGIGWVKWDRTVRHAEKVRQAQESLIQARTLVAENQVALALQKLADTGAQLAQDTTGAGQLDRGDRYACGHPEPVGSILHPDQSRLRGRVFSHPRSRPGRGHAAPGRVPPADVFGERQPAQTVPLLRQALALYSVLEREDWFVTVEDCGLGKEQVDQIRRATYEALLWLADDVIHGTGSPIRPTALSEGCC